MQNNNMHLIKTLALLLIPVSIWGMRSSIVAESHYGILGIEPQATHGAIKKAYQKEALKWHPDKNPNNIKQATERFKSIHQAYDILSTDHTRSAYDKLLAHELRQSTYTKDRDLAENLDPDCLSTLILTLSHLLNPFIECFQQQ